MSSGFSAGLGFRAYGLRFKTQDFGSGRYTKVIKDICRDIWGYISKSEASHHRVSVLAGVRIIIRIIPFWGVFLHIHFRIILNRPSFPYDPVLKLRH